MNKLNIKEGNKLLVMSIIPFFLLLCAILIILLTPTATTYEMNIYAVFPWFFWLFLILAIFTGILLMIESYTSTIENNYGKIGLLAVINTNIILLAMPLIRNYPTYGREDVLFHIGGIEQIINTGNIGSDFYPVIHILGSYLSLLTGISPQTIPMIIEPIFCIFYIVSFYLLFKELFQNKKEVFLAMVFPSILIFSGSVEYLPFTQSVLTIPFFLFIYYKLKTTDINQYKFLLVLLTFLFLFFHPLTAVALLVILLILEFSEYVKFKTKDQHFNYRSTPYYVVGAFLIGFLIWKPYSNLLLGTFSSVYYSIAYGGSVQLTQTMNIAVKVTPIYFIVALFDFYGQYFLIVIGSLIAIYLLLIDNKREFKIKTLDFLRRSNVRNITKIFTGLESYYIFSVITFLFFLVCTVLSYFEISTFGFTRFLYFVIIFASFLIFYLLYRLLHVNYGLLNNKKVKIILLSLFLLPIITFSTFNMYISPITKSPNEQVTQSEITGMETFFAIKDNSTVLNLGINQFRFEDLIMGEQVNQYGYSKLIPLDHFGYTNNTPISTFYNESIYLVINDIGRDYYPEVYPNYQNRWTFTPQDFQNLSNDHGMQYIYDNGNLQIYKSS